MKKRAKDMKYFIFPLKKGGKGGLCSPLKKGDKVGCVNYQDS